MTNSHDVVQNTKDYLLSSLPLSSPSSTTPSFISSPSPSQSSSLPSYPQCACSYLQSSPLSSVLLKLFEDVLSNLLVRHRTMTLFYADLPTIISRQQIFSQTNFTVPCATYLGVWWGSVCVFRKWSSKQ